MRTYGLIMILGVTLAVPACGGDQKQPETPEQGPMESAGEAVDEAADDVGETTEDVVDETGDAIGDTGDAIDEETEDEN